MKFLCRQFLQLALGVAAAAAMAPGADAQDAYPSRPVHIVVGYSAGGSATLWRG